MYRIRFAAVGDILFTAGLDGAIPERGLEALSDGVRELFESCDIVFGNLECTLAGRETIPTEPLVVSSEKQIRSLQNTGIDVVTLGNNHTFDCLNEGFYRMGDVLADLRIPWCGAGLNIAEAFQPAIVKAHGVTLAFLGVVDKSSGQFRFAGESTSGVAPLDTGRVCRIIKDLRHEVDHVIVSPHWGEERFRVPSLGQQRVLDGRYLPYLESLRADRMRSRCRIRSQRHSGRSTDPNIRRWQDGLYREIRMGISLSSQGQSFPGSGRYAKTIRARRIPHSYDQTHPFAPEMVGIAADPPQTHPQSHTTPASKRKEVNSTEVRRSAGHP